MDNQTPGTNQIDPTALQLSRAIRQAETNGNYTLNGKSGEKGAYQWMPGNFESAAKKYGLDPSDFSQTNQDHVAYMQIKEQLDAGHSQSEVASWWNSGKYDPTGNVGVNKQGVAYNTPGYVDKVKQYYSQSQPTGQFVDPNQSSQPSQQFVVPPPIQQTPQTSPPSIPSPQSSVDTYGATFPASPTDSVGMAGLKALGNVPSSIGHMAQGLLNTVAHPIDFSNGLLNTLSGGVETGLNKVFGKNVSDKQTQTFESVLGALKDRYGGLDNLQRTATNDPAGFGADVLTLMEGGTTGFDALTGGNTNATLNSTLESVAHPIAEGIKKVASAPLRLAGEVKGIDTGAGYGNIKEGLNATAQGGKASEAFNNALGGNTNPEDLVDKAKDALNEVVNNRRISYQNGLQQIAGNTTQLDLSPVQEEVQNQLQKFNITQTPEGGLDFSRSKFALDTSAQNDITKLTGYVNSYGNKAGDLSAVGIDNLKQIVGSYWSPNSDYRAFVQGIKNSIWNPSENTGVLSQIPGYQGTMADYSEATDQIKDIQKGLSLGDKASVDTAFKKLISSMRQNNDFRRMLVQDLDSATGGTLLPSIAGQQLSPWLPRGLAGIAEGVGGLGAAVMNPSIILPLIGAAITTSPQIVGRFIQALGLGVRASNAVMSVVNAIVPEALVTGNLSNRIESK